MTFSNEDPREQLHVRLDSEFKERVESVAKTHNMSLNELACTALNEFLPNEETSAGPTDSKLREPYLWLRDHSDECGEIPAKLAKTALAQELSMTKELVQKTRFLPLERRSWIEPEFGTITVITPEERNNE